MYEYIYYLQRINASVYCDFLAFHCNITAGGDSSFELYDPAEKKLTTLDVIPVPSDHAGVTQDADNPLFMFAKGNSFYFGN